MTPRGRLFPIRRVASHISRLGLTGSYNSRIFNLFAMARKRQFCSWSDLPRDVIDFIVNSLWCVDQIRFRAVCRSWQAANIVKYADKLPWKMGLEFRFVPSLRPFSQTKYTQSSMSVLIEEDKTLKEFLMVLLGLLIQNRIGCFFQNRVSATGKLDSASTILSPAKSLNFRIPTIAKSILRATKQASQRFQFLRSVWSSVFILSVEEEIVSACVNLEIKNGLSVGLLVILTL